MSGLYNPNFSPARPVSPQIRSTPDVDSNHYFTELLGEHQKIAPFMQVLLVCSRLLNQGLGHASFKDRVKKSLDTFDFDFSKGQLDCPWQSNHSIVFGTASSSYEILRVSGMMPNQGFGELDRLRHRSPRPMASSNLMSSVSGTGLGGWNGLPQELLQQEKKMATTAQLRNFPPISSRHYDNHFIRNHRHLSDQSPPSSSLVSFPHSSSPSMPPLRTQTPFLLKKFHFSCAVGGNGSDGVGRGTGGGGGSGGWDSIENSNDSSPSWVGPIGAFLNGWRSRVAADPQFPFKVLMEELVGVTACVIGDMASRPNFGLNELDFVFSTLVVGCILNFVLMYLLAPTMSVSTSTLPSIFANCPAGRMFEPGPCGLISRLGTFVYKGVLFSAVGFAAGLVGTAISNGLIKMRKKMDPNFETPNKALPTILNAATWAIHVGSSVVVLRCLNNVLGGMSFVILARLTGAQSVGEEKQLVTDEAGLAAGKEKLINGSEEDSSILLQLPIMAPQTQLVIWEKGPRLRIYLKLFPTVSNGQSSTFNTSEILRIRGIFTSWEFPDTDLFGPYELLSFTLLGPYSYVNFETGGKTISKGILIDIVLAAVACAVTTSTIVTFFAARRHSRNQHTISRNNLSSKMSIKIDGVKSFTLEEMALAADNFNSSSQVGQGGCWEVYRGILSDNTVVAIKRAKEGMLVYEFMPNGTLKDCLSAKSKETLNFGVRLQIALGSAKGVLYLHTEAHPPIFHRDIKASNILLDSKFSAEVFDFGLSRLAPLLDDEANMPNHVSTIVRGTPGYLDPEYLLTRKLTDKGDVYSLGVVFMEILTGMQPISHGKNIVRKI
ncbi:unnamed protein product [Camellia sinensis]